MVWITLRWLFRLLLAIAVDVRTRNIGCVILFTTHHDNSTNSFVLSTKKALMAFSSCKHWGTDAISGLVHLYQDPIYFSKTKIKPVNHHYLKASVQNSTKEFPQPRIQLSILFSLTCFNSWRFTWYLVLKHA